MVLAMMVLTASVVLSVAAVVVFVIPVSLVQLPAFLVVVVVRMTPVGAFVGSMVPASLDPAVVVAIGDPISFYPGVARAGHRPAFLVADRRRRGSDVHRNLGRAGDADRGRQKRGIYRIEFQL